MGASVRVLVVLFHAICGLARRMAAAIAQGAQAGARFPGRHVAGIAAKLAG